LFFTCTITAANLCNVVFHNFTADPINLGSSIWHFWLFPAATCNFQKTQDPGSLDDGVGETLTYALNQKGYFGDYVMGTLGVDSVDFNVSTYIATAGNVEMRLENETGAAEVNLGPATSRIWIWKPEDGWKK
jgi:hypothetical protein